MRPARAPIPLRPARAFVAALQIAALATAVEAGPPKPARRAGLPPAAAPIYVLDKAASRLAFSADALNQPGGGKVEGVIRTWDAQIAFDARNLKASRVVITASTASLGTGDPTRDEVLAGPAWFAVKRYPKASFVTTAITAAGPGAYTATGDLRVRGAVQRITAPLTASIDHDVLKLDGALPVRRTALGLGPRAEAAPDAVGATVTLTLRLVAKKDR